MHQQRYDMRKEADGSWTVFDIETGDPAEVENVPQNGLEMEQADDLTDLLNYLETKRRKETAQ